MQHLVESGWVRLIPDPADRRSAFLEPTEEGRAHLTVARQSLVDYLAGVFQQLTPEELHAFQVVSPAFQRILEQPESTPDVE